MENGAPVPPALSSSSLIALVPPIAKLVEAASIPKLAVILTPTANAKKAATQIEEVHDESTHEEVLSVVELVSILFNLDLVCWKNVFVSVAAPWRTSLTVAVQGQ
jgi:hypothetical protein